MSTMKELYTVYVSLTNEPKPIKSFPSKAKLQGAIDQLSPPRIARSLTKIERARLRRYVRKNNLDVHPHGSRWSSHDVTPELLALIAA
jgi:hypothetical protein